VFVMTLLTSEIRTRRATADRIQSLACRTHSHITETLSRRDNITLKSNLKKLCTDRRIRHTETDRYENQTLHPLHRYHRIMLCPSADHQTKAFAIILKKTLWSESASELYRPSDRRLSAKQLPTFADRRCHVVRVTDPYGRRYNII
jgi:hypothetical protein